MSEEKRIVIRFPRMITEGARQQFESLGFEFCKCAQLDDELFETAILPRGWRYQRHEKEKNYYTIKTPKDVTRVLVYFNKGSLLRGQNPQATIRLLKRFCWDYKFDSDDRFYEVIVRDNERQSILKKWSIGNSHYNGIEFKEAVNEAKAFLDKEYPNWKDSLAYWSD